MFSAIRVIYSVILRVVSKFIDENLSAIDKSFESLIIYINFSIDM
jgi:hypothetical protein